MKKYFLLFVLAFACVSTSSFAQLQAGAQHIKKEPLLQIPMVQIRAVESLFVPVHIDLAKPFATTLNPIVFGKQENAACEHFKKYKASLILSGERVNDVTANLHWETKYAFYATGFDVERSLGDSLHFSAVHSVPVSKATNFKLDYHLPDGNNYSGTTYYRLKQHNNDTGFAYSNVVSISGYSSVVLSLYPIPATNKLWVGLLPKQSGNIHLSLYDLTGKLITQQTISCFEKISVKESLDISKFAPGAYHLKLLMPDQTIITGKFVKQ